VAAEQGVSMIINGNSGKTSAGSVTDGGFRGWTMLGIDPRHGVVEHTPGAPANRWTGCGRRPIRVRTLDGHPGWPGTAELTVVVNGVKASVKIQVHR